MVDPQGSAPCPEAPLVVMLRVWSVAMVAAVVAAALPAVAAAETAERDMPFAGTWSVNPSTCLRTTDEDERRVTIEGSRYDEYGGECRIDDTQERAPGSYSLILSCAKVKGAETRIVRVLMRNPSNAVFSEMFARGRPSADMVRCPTPTVSDPEDFMQLEHDDLLNSASPESLRKTWQKVFRLCAGGGPRAGEACMRRRYLSMRLRKVGYCHVTRRIGEGWEFCR